MRIFRAWFTKQGKLRKSIIPKQRRYVCVNFSRWFTDNAQIKDQRRNISFTSQYKAIWMPKDGLRWSKLLNLALIMLQKIPIWNKCCCFERYSSNNSETFNCITVSTKLWSSTKVFNIANNQKCFLSSKSAHFYDFWRPCDTEDWSYDDVIIFHKFTVSLYFLIK